MNKHLYTFTCDSTNQKFTEYLTDEGAKQVLSALNYCGQNQWSFKSAFEEMTRYNEIVTSEEYKREVEQFNQVCSGTNLKMRVNRFHSILNIRPLEGRQIFETFKF